MGDIFDGLPRFVLEHGAQKRWNRTRAHYYSPRRDARTYPSRLKVSFRINTRSRYYHGNVWAMREQFQEDGEWHSCVSRSERSVRMDNVPSWAMWTYIENKLAEGWKIVEGPSWDEFKKRAKAEQAEWKERARRLRNDSARKQREEIERLKHWHAELGRDACEEIASLHRKHSHRLKV